MNIFAIDLNPIIAACQQHDRHIVKMPVETAQMLCAVSWRFGISAPYKPTHIHHPVTLWVGETYDNWMWTIKHGMALCFEYEKRYMKKHKSEEVIRWCHEFGGHAKERLQTSHFLAMPDQYKRPDVVASYRAFYIGEKLFDVNGRPNGWRRNKPNWIPKD